MSDLAARWERLRDARLPYAPERRRRVATAVIFGLLFGAGLIVVSIGFTISRLASEPGPPAVDRSPVVVDVDPVGPSTHVNGLGGYSFEAPPGWEIRDRGSSSRLTSPDGDIVMSFGAGRPGSLEAAVQALSESIRQVYENVSLGSAPQATMIEGHPAVLTSGSLDNAAGVPVRFLAIAIRLGGENLLIGVFVSQPADAAEVLPAVDDVIGSLEPMSGRFASGS
jgi:hypothetical protein